MTDIISEADILRIHGDADFGDRTPLTWNAFENPHLTPFGQKYARKLWPEDKTGKPSPDVDIRDQIADIIYRTKGATLAHQKAADEIVELIGLNGNAAQMPVFKSTRGAA